MNNNFPFTRLPTRNQKTGLIQLTLSAPTYTALMDAREHLRYWPYIKSCHPLTAKSLSVTILIGHTDCPKCWSHYCARAIELMSLCLRQYHATFSGSTDELTQFQIPLTGETYLRPNSLIKPFSNFIDELN